MNEIFYEMEESFNNFMIETENFIKINLKDKYIEKDKIREKIKELEWYGDYIRYRFVYTDYDKQVNKAKIEILNELLEEK